MRNLSKSKIIAFRQCPKRLPAESAEKLLPDVEQSLLLRQQSPAPDADDLSNDSFLR
jgi:hypothetical protein